MTTDTLSLDINREFIQAFDMIENSSRHLFITGKAGTGKSTFLQYYRDSTAKNIAVLAPTGVAALNIKGQTIHSFFNFKPDITPETVRSVRLRPKMRSVYKNLDALIIDEISMVRADLIDCIDMFLRAHGPRSGKTFGGVQMVFLGDLYQLAPVVRKDEEMIFRTHYEHPYFFAAHAFHGLPLKIFSFEKNYRQTDAQFIDLLNEIRTDTVSFDTLKLLNSRVRPPAANQRVEDYTIYLTTTNYLANKINTEQLEKISDELFTFDGAVSGDFDPKSLPTHLSLDLKTGAQVMLLNNDPEQRWINGSIGRITGIAPAGDGSACVQIAFADGRTVDVEPFTWELFQFTFNEEIGAIESQVIGAFRQLPIRLAWAVTIHKSQGKTFDRVVIDIGSGTFCHGQMYVALSRCRTLEGISLKKAVNQRDIMVDRRVQMFLSRLQDDVSGRDLSLEDKRHLIEDAIDLGQALEISYLTDKGIRTRMNIRPRHLNRMEANGLVSWRVEAILEEGQTAKIFRLNRIMTIKKIFPENI